jgi:hypothetical protein
LREKTPFQKHLVSTEGARKTRKSPAAPRRRGDAEKIKGKAQPQKTQKPQRRIKKQGIWDLLEASQKCYYQRKLQPARAKA